jgi:hypothetical protein
MRTIPIANLASEFSDCEESGIVPKQNLPLARREFLKGSGILMGTLAAGSVLAGLAPSTVWAVELKTLSKAEGETLMAMGRVIYPHKKLPDAVYAILAKDLDGAAPAVPTLPRCCAKALPTLTVWLVEISPKPKPINVCR